MARRQTTLILTRDARGPIAPLEAPAGIRVVYVVRPGDEGFAELDSLCRSYDFPASWVADMLATGAEAFAAIPVDPSPSLRAVAAGWLTRKPFYVDEIGYTFTPVPEGDYYFGDFVEPAWRGRKLQRLLIHRRLEASAAAGRLWAFSMMRRDNPASLRSYQAEQFQPAARLRTMRVAGLGLDRLVPLHPDFPHGWLFTPGWDMPFSLRLRGRNRG